MRIRVFSHCSLTSARGEDNRPLRTRHQLLLVAVVLVGLSPFAFSSTVAVGTCTTLPFYSSIQLAVNSVPSGSTIKICPGTYAEQVLITKSLTLIGVGANGLSGGGAMGQYNPVITSPAGGVTANVSDLAGGDPIFYQIAVVNPAPASTVKVNISDIAIDGSNNQISGCGMNLTGIYYQNANGTINEVVARNQELPSGLGGCQDGDGILIESGYGSGGTAVVTIQNSSVHGYDKNGITVDGSGTSATLIGNYVIGQGATPVTAQNGIQISDGANGLVKNNTITDDLYINPSDCSTTTPQSCYGSSGILVFDSGATAGHALTISGNTISNTQLPIIAFGDSNGTADYNSVTANKITSTQAAGIFLDDGIDLCSNNNTATGNSVFNSSGSGIHIDSTCVESTGPSGNGTTVSTNTINEACAGVLTGTGTGNTESGNITANVVETIFPGDSCPGSTSSDSAKKTARLAKATKLRPVPLLH
jgi:hypothetical protein